MTRDAKRLSNHDPRTSPCGSGVVSLSLVRRPVFGWPGEVASWAFLAGLTAFLVLVSLPVLGIELDAGPLNLYVLLLLAVGQFAFGVVTVCKDVLAHARSGGVVLALSFSFAAGVVFPFTSLGLGRQWLLSILLAAPFSLSWMVFGLDLLTAGEGDVETVSFSPAD